jgi:ketosteroid isomerase-like protein
MDSDTQARAALEQHWAASESGDIETEHDIYAADAILDYPQSGERFRGRATIAAQRGGHPPIGTSASCGSPAARTCG